MNKHWLLLSPLDHISPRECGTLSRAQGALRVVPSTSSPVILGDPHPSRKETTRDKWMKLPSTISEEAGTMTGTCKQNFISLLSCKLLLFFVIPKIFPHNVRGGGGRRGGGGEIPYGEKKYQGRELVCGSACLKLVCGSSSITVGLTNAAALLWTCG